MVQKWMAFVASGAGSGYAPRAPGTFGSAAFVAIWWILSATLVSLGLVSQFILTVALSVLFTLLGLVAISKLLERGDSHDPSPDPQWMVVDEWAGMGFSLLFTQYSDCWEVLVAFALFRFFDASKVGPVGRVEQLPGAVGVMADDVVAGICALGTLHLVKEVSSALCG